jgi:hypothetical protein
MTTTTRRAILAGAAALPALAIPAVAASADAELIELGRQLVPAITRNLEMEVRWNTECGKIHAAAEARVPRSDDPSNWAKTEAWLAAFKDESERAPESHRVAEAKLSVAAQTFDDLCKRILTLRPETLAGLGTLALATAAMLNTTGVYDHEPHEREVDEEYATALVEAVTRLAGVAIPFDTAV